MFDKGFQSFLKETFNDLSEYDVEIDYITSKQTGLELGFTNNDAVYDVEGNVVLERSNPLFSHFIIYPKSLKLISELPFDINFTDRRFEIINKAGKPSQTNEGYSDFLNKNFLVDNYKTGETVITFDFDAQKQTINFIQVRDNNLVEHLKL